MNNHTFMKEGNVQEYPLSLPGRSRILASFEYPTNWSFLSRIKKMIDIASVRKRIDAINLYTYFPRQIENIAVLWPSTTIID